MHILSGAVSSYYFNQLATWEYVLDSLDLTDIKLKNEYENGLGNC